MAAPWARPSSSSTVARTSRRPPSASAVGEDRFLAEACNLPVSGGSSLASILWIRDHEPGHLGGGRDVRSHQHVPGAAADGRVGHRPLDDVDHRALRDRPHTTSPGTTRCSRPPAWRPHRLPRLMQSYDAVGRDPARRSPTSSACPATSSSSAVATTPRWRPGRAACPSPATPTSSAAPATSPTSAPTGPWPRAEFNVRAHVLPGRWLTFFVLNTGGIALDWFHRTFCRELDADAFYGEYLPATLEAFLDDPVIDERESGTADLRPVPGRQPLLARAAGRGLRLA